MGQNHSDRRNHVANGSNVDIYVQVLRWYYHLNFLTSFSLEGWTYAYQKFWWLMAISMLLRRYLIILNWKSSELKSSKFIFCFSDTVSSEVRKKYGANVKFVYGIEVSPEYSFEKTKKTERLAGETVIRPGDHLAFSPNADKTAYISVRTADKPIA